MTSRQVALATSAPHEKGLLSGRFPSALAVTARAELASRSTLADLRSGRRRDALRSFPRIAAVYRMPHSRAGARR